MKRDIFGWLLLVCFSNFTHGMLSPEKPAILDPDTGLDLRGFLLRHNYTFYENHTVLTPDNYYVSSIRLPRARGETPSHQKKPVVLLMHGFPSNPQIFMIQGNRSIAFLLTEAGYDVWLIAARGCTYSMRHKHFSPDSVEYWNFSFHETAIYDIPAYIDYIKKVTGNTKITYLGYSMGAAAFLAFAATQPEHLKSISMAHLWGPIVYAKYARTTSALIYNNWEIIDYIIKSLNMYKGYKQHNSLNMWKGILMCNINSPLLNWCIKKWNKYGPDPDQMDLAKLTVYMTNDPAGGSLKTAMHLYQVLKAEKFQYYDYQSENVLMYGQSTPPLYNLSAISGNVPFYIWTGLNDYFAGEEDFDQLIRETRGSIKKVVPWDRFNHIDFVAAKDAKELLYDELIDILNKYHDRNKKTNPLLRYRK